MSGNLYLTGFMGSGKNTVGRELAEALNRKFLDMDGLLEKRLGMPVRDIFSRYGQERFRDAETRLLQSFCRMWRYVIATGGGVVEREKNVELMRRSGTIVHLGASLETCMMRLSEKEREERPLWTDEEGLRGLYQRRLGSYDRCHLRIQVDGRRPAEIVTAILEALFPGERFSLVLDGADCPVASSWNPPGILTEWARGRRVFLLTDHTVARLHLRRYLGALDRPVVHSIRPGEGSKRLRLAARIYEALCRHRMERGDLFVALGGGVVTDLGAFVASTYMRGMPFILIGTTPIACADAAIGGKAAVNLGGMKNIVGCFTVPLGVLLDLPALRTCPGRLIREGLVEAYKTGLVVSQELAGIVEKRLPALLQGDMAELACALIRASRAKALVVSKDFRESGDRRVLNFGHTLGHAVETLSGYRIGHGRAVAAGMAVATRISRLRGLISGDLEDRILAVLRSLFPRRIGLPPAREIWSVMQHDKKVRGGRLVFVLLEGAGRAVCVDDVTRRELEGAQASLEPRLLRPRRSAPLHESPPRSGQA